MLNRPDLSPEHPANQLPVAMLRGGDNKFEAKLTFAQRCSMLALHLSNMSVASIAAVFHVNRRTVTHAVNPTSTRYRNVRAERDRLGEQLFITTYLTQDVIDRVTEAANSPEAKASYSEHDKTPGSVKEGRPNRLAKINSGINVYKGPNHAFTHRIEIVWVEDVAGYDNGWYSKLLDTDTPDAAIGNPDEKSHMTSLSALQWAKRHLDSEY